MIPSAVCADGSEVTASDLIGGHAPALRRIAANDDREIRPAVWSRRVGARLQDQTGELIGRERDDSARGLRGRIGGHRERQRGAGRILTCYDDRAAEEEEGASSFAAAAHRGPGLRTRASSVS